MKAAPLLVAVLAATLVAGCSGSGAPPEGAGDGGPTVEPPWTPDGRLWGPCTAWNGVVDAPAGLFPQGTPYHPVAGTRPSTVQARADAVHCGSESADLWVGWPVEEGGVLLGSVASSNQTRAEWYATLGLPIGPDVPRGYYALRSPGGHADGVGYEDGSVLLFVYSVNQTGPGPDVDIDYLAMNGPNLAGTLHWGQTGSAPWGRGVAQIGDSAVLNPEHWNGQGQRQAASTITVTWKASPPS